MNWTTKDTKTGKQEAAPQEKVQVFEKEKAASLPEMLKEASSMRPFDPIRFQPVESPGIYEAEFGNKGGDLLFHFWPHGYHEAERRGIASTRFHNRFESVLRSVMNATFGEHRVEVTEDTDVGAWFVKAKGWSDNTFARELSVKACQQIHKELGGKG